MSEDLRLTELAVSIRDACEAAGCFPDIRVVERMIEEHYAPQSAELERLKTACDNRLCSACLEVHPLGATCPPHEMRTTGSAWFRGRMSELQQAVSEAESRANERGRRVHDLEQQVRRNAEDWAETDTHVRTVSKRFLPAAMVDGDSDGVPPLELVVDALSDHIDKVEQQVAGLTAENAELRGRVEFCCNVDVPEQVAALLADAERYGWIKSRARGEGSDPTWFSWGLPHVPGRHRTLDIAIDDAIEADKRRA